MHLPLASFHAPHTLPNPQRRTRTTCSHHPPVTARAPNYNNKNNSADDDDDVPTDTVLSRRVFVLGVGAIGLFAATEGAQLFFGDEYKDVLLAPLKRAAPVIFPKEQERAPAPRAPLDTAFASFYFDQHREVAVRMGLLSAEQLALEEGELLSRSLPLFFAAGEQAANAIEEYNYRLYSRVHSISKHTSPAQRVAFSRALGEAAFKRIAAASALPDPRPARRDLRGALATEDLLSGLRAVLAQLQAIGWVTGSRIDELDPLMLADEGRGELSITCDDVFTLPTAMLIGEEEFEEMSPKVSGILLACMAYYGCRDISSEDYYLDTVYRSNAKNFAPTQLLTQINFIVA
jgi:hypothetical protein